MSTTPTHTPTPSPAQSAGALAHALERRGVTAAALVDTLPCSPRQAGGIMAGDPHAVTSQHFGTPAALTGISWPALVEGVEEGDELLCDRWAPHADDAFEAGVRDGRRLAAQ